MSKENAELIRRAYHRDTGGDTWAARSLSWTDGGRWPWHAWAR